MKVLVARIAMVAGTCLATACQHAAEPAHAPHWTYAGDAGPEHWAALSPEFAVCGSGHRQSPIDIAATAPQDLPNIGFHYQPSKLNIVNNGHTIQVNYDAGSYIDLDGARYDLEQFHFHAPSEHTSNGKAADAEVHFVHKNADGQLAVIGVLIEAGDANTALAPAWEHLLAHEGPVQTFDMQIAAEALLPADRLTDRYIGSLTTPPCTEDVRWNVMTSPIYMSSSQLDALKRIVGHNNRPIQPLFDRKVLQDTSR